MSALCGFICRCFNRPVPISTESTETTAGWTKIKTSKYVDTDSDDADAAPDRSARGGLVYKYEDDKAFRKEPVYPIEGDGRNDLSGSDDSENSNKNTDVVGESEKEDIEMVHSGSGLLTSDTDSGMGTLKSRSVMDLRTSKLQSQNRSLISLNSCTSKDEELLTSGEVVAKLEYDAAVSVLSVHIVSANGLPSVRSKKSTTGSMPSPYAKVYLLPDKDRVTKRKTSVRKPTCDPEFNETINYTVQPESVDRHLILIEVWHKGRYNNIGLGEVIIGMEDINSNSHQPIIYRLQPAGSSPKKYCLENPNRGFSTVTEEPKRAMMSIELQMVTSTDEADVGSVNCTIVSVTGLGSHGGQLWVKGLLSLGDGEPRKSKTKPAPRPEGGDVVFNHVLEFNRVTVDQLNECNSCLMLTLWQEEKRVLKSKTQLGAVRLGTGDTTEECRAWQSFVSKPRKTHEIELQIHQ